MRKFLEHRPLQRFMGEALRLAEAAAALSDHDDPRTAEIVAAGRRLRPFPAYTASIGQKQQVMDRAGAYHRWLDEIQRDHLHKI